MNRKQLIIVLFSLIASVGIFSCKKIRDLKKFEIEYDSSFTLPPTGFLGGIIETPPQRMETNVSTALEDQGTKEKWVKSVILKAMDLTISNPSDEDFNFLESIEIYIDAPGEDEVMIAYSHSIPQNVNTLELTTATCNIKEHLLSDELNIRTVANASNRSEITIVANFTFELEAQLKLFK